MADFTKNITNTVNVFGESTKWGQANPGVTMTWGVAKWGDSERQSVNFQKVVSNSQVFTWDVASLVVDYNRTLSVGTFVVSSDMSLEALRSGQWYVVFTSDTTNAEERDFASWTEGSRPDVTFTCQAAGNTSWSEA